MSTRLINRHPILKSLVILLGILSIAYIILGIIAYLSIFPAPAKGTALLGIVIYFVLGIAHGAIAIFLYTCKETAPLHESHEEK